MNIDKLRLLSEHYTLNEGGAVGHLSHLYDNWDLTFGELKDVIASAADGKLQRVSEKLDGQNLVFTFNSTGLKVARGSGDIKSGGMDAASLAKKFGGHKNRNVEEGFNLAFKVLNDAMGAIPEKSRLQVFEGGRVWYSIEVIYTKNPNVINYDRDCIVFHQSPSFRIEANGTVKGHSAAPGVAVLQRHIDQMQKALTLKSWAVRGPAVVRLKKIDNGEIVMDTINAIEQAQNAGGVGDSDTIGDYLHNVIEEEVADLGLTHEATEAVAARIVQMQGAPGLPQIKKMVPRDVYQSVKEFVDNQKTLMQHAIMPIEHAIHKFAVELLRGLHSVMVSNGDAEVARLKQQVAGAVNALEKTGDSSAMDVLHTQMEKLGNVENITSAIEGVVFVYKGNAYKVTGNFAPINQILGLFKYGRGSAAAISETVLKNTINEMLVKNGML